MHQCFLVALSGVSLQVKALCRAASYFYWLVIIFSCRCGWSKMQPVCVLPCMRHAASLSLWCKETGTSAFCYYEGHLHNMPLNLWFTLQLHCQLQITTGPLSHSISGLVEFNVQCQILTTKCFFTYVSQKGHKYPVLLLILYSVSCLVVGKKIPMP